MLDKEFKIWLKTENQSDRTIQSRVSNCRKVELFEGDLDQFYELDRGEGILTKLTYSMKEYRDGTPTKHRIPIDGNLRTGTSTFKQAVSLYFKFKTAQINFSKEIKKLDKKLNKIISNEDLSESEKRVLTKFRIGQSEFRKRLIDYWKGECSVSKLGNVDLLIASHIKPYSECVGVEKYDLFNGLLLSPAYDKLFDKFLISFDDMGGIIISDLLLEKDRNILNISESDFVNIVDEHKKYLKYHNERLLIKQFK